MDMLFRQWLAAAFLMLVAAALVAGEAQDVDAADGRSRDRKGARRTPTATALPGTPGPTATPTTTLPPPGPSCSKTIQSLVDGAAAGSVVNVPSCVYRETVRITKPLTLVGQPGAEIRGSDVWSSGWTRSGNYWVRGTVPTFGIHGECRSGTSRCRWPEQVFLDGQPLTQAVANPGRGQFAIDKTRNVVLADDPTKGSVEVTTRTRWIVIQADGVTIQGFTMKHAANDSQSGAIGNDDRSNWTLRNSVLSDAHGGVVSLTGGSSLRLLDNDISRGGQLGVHGYRATGALVQGNRIHDNNTEGFDPSWEAGGLKIVRHTNATLDGNEVWGNQGPGLWCDIDCTGAVISNNRVHDNTKPGIAYEISRSGRIFGNTVWRNGWENPDWGVGAGILCDGCDHTEIYDNTLAWNANGITILSQNRADSQLVVQNHVHDNRIISGVLPNYSTALAWNENWAGPLFTPASNNRGSGNAYWFSSPESSVVRFGWNGHHSSLGSFNATPGEEGGWYLSATEKDQLLSAAGMPLSP